MDGGNQHFHSLSSNKNNQSDKKNDLKVLKAARHKYDATRVLHKLTQIILESTKAANAGEQIDQLILNKTYAAYFHLLHEFDLDDKDFGNFLVFHLIHNDEFSFQKLLALLQTNQLKTLDSQNLKVKCLEALCDALKTNCSSILTILKTLNCLCNKFMGLHFNVSIAIFYDCLQIQQHLMREETLVFFSHCCKSQKLAISNFKLIIHCWPWTNRNKLYLLSSILNLHNLDYLLGETNFSTTEFFSGLRLSLSYKKLLAPSQYLIRAISKQNSRDLLNLSIEILARGSRFEVQNFYAQWFSRINQQDKLFELIQQDSDIVQFLLDFNSTADYNENEVLRLIIIFSMFSDKIFKASKLHFFKISTELITNCFKFDTEVQLLIFRFIVDNFCHYAIEDCMEFLFCFIQQHISSDSARFRNTILGKVPTIINYIARTYNKLHEMPENTTFEKSIQEFFEKLHQILVVAMCSDLYQPKIFSLKMLEILCYSLYGKKLTKNAKNCIMVQNQKLGEFLLQHKVIDISQFSTQIVELLGTSKEFEDALDTITNILLQLNYSDTAKVEELCRITCKSCDVDACALSTYYARVTINSFRTLDNMAEKELKLFEFAFEALKVLLKDFENDPLLTLKTKSQFFGYLNTLEQTLFQNSSVALNYYGELINFLEIIVETVLDFLNLAKTCDTMGASFQDMDASLELLEKRSAFAIENSSECRQFLLISFWLTLKSCCDLATLIGCTLVDKCKENEANLLMCKSCLNINVLVLTRCRHKGAIESAGLSIGILIKSITSQLKNDSATIGLVDSCLQLLFDEEMEVNTTRRGAGFSIMLLHIVRNEHQQSRPILKNVMNNIFKKLKVDKTNLTNQVKNNCDRLEALTLHYLCVLVKDTDLRIALSKYYDKIMMTAILQIDDLEWTICNAALQLFGSLVPKILGQKQAIEYNDNKENREWESMEVTYREVQRLLPKMCEYILDYIGRSASNANGKPCTSTRSILLFLCFFARVENLRLNFDESSNKIDTFCERVRKLLWGLLRHPCENVRKLAAVCFVRATEFYLELPVALLNISKHIFIVRNENLFHGLICTLIEGITKIQNDSRHTFNIDYFLQTLRLNLQENYNINLRKHKFFTIRKLLDLLILLKFDTQSVLYKEVSNYQLIKENCIGINTCYQKIN